MKKIILILICFACSMFAHTQERKLDGVIAVIGPHPILASELEKRKAQASLDSTEFEPCVSLEDIMYQKLLLVQADKDSVVVSEDQVEGELDTRLRYFIGQFGTIKAFEEYLGKSIEAFKAESRDDLREVLLVQRMQGRITEGVKISPLEVREYFARLSADSIPFINAELEVGRIIAIPKVNPELKDYAKERLTSIREEIVSGKKTFHSAAILNSMDPGSATNGGLYKGITRGQFVPEFDAVAFRMEEKKVSEVFETSFGYHILSVDEIRGEELDVRHILIIPEPSADDLLAAKAKLDSVVDLVLIDSISLGQAASRFSEDEETRHNGGLLTNPFTGNTRFELSQLSAIDPNPNFAFTVDNLKPGVPSSPSQSQYQGKMAYQVLFVKSRSEPHRANLVDDYQRLQEEALAEKKNTIVNRWIGKKAPGVHVFISQEYRNCNFDNAWVKSE